MKDCWMIPYGNPNSQGTLKWIIQILHYYYRKQHKNIENSQIIEQNLVSYISLPFSLFTTVNDLPYAWNYCYFYDKIKFQRSVIATLKFDFIVEIAAAYVTYSSSRPKSFCKIDILEKFAKFTRKHLYWSRFFNRVAALRAEACFPVNCAKFLRKLFL